MTNGEPRCARLRTDFASSTHHLGARSASRTQVCHSPCCRRGQRCRPANLLYMFGVHLHNVIPRYDAVLPDPDLLERRGDENAGDSLVKGHVTAMNYPSP